MLSPAKLLFDILLPMSVPASILEAVIRNWGTVSLSNIIFAAITKNIAPSMNPAGIFSLENTAPPAAAITSVNMTLIVLSSSRLFNDHIKPS